MFRNLGSRIEMQVLIVIVTFPLRMTFLYFERHSKKISFEKNASARNIQSSNISKHSRYYIRCGSMAFPTLNSKTLKLDILSGSLPYVASFEHSITRCIITHTGFSRLKWTLFWENNSFPRLRKHSTTPELDRATSEGLFRASADLHSTEFYLFTNVNT